MTTDKKLVMLIRADNLTKRKDGKSNYQDTLEQKLFLSKPVVFHEEDTTDGKNTGMVDKLDGSVLSNPTNGGNRTILDTYQLDDKKSNISLYNLSYIGVSESDIADNFDITNLTAASFTSKFIKDIQEANIANNRGLSFISGNDFATLFNDYLLKINEGFYANWVNYDMRLPTGLPKEDIAIPYGKLFESNFSNLPSKKGMHEYRLCLQLNHFCSELGKLIDYSPLTNISFTKMNNIFQ
ncbi:hypothetical protein [Lactiplantibacillus plantarum]|uniref:hypothetical protein n=1 Tax=Lactiplantibacillus plantarum TaxID=1590 RepID=UPI0009785627|nr:hypothetical protein [Lactiplantibacillus plantarum]